MSDESKQEWTSYDREDGGVEMVPLGDDYEHVDGEHCGCDPDEDENSSDGTPLFVHNDMRHYSGDIVAEMHRIEITYGLDENGRTVHSVCFGGDDEALPPVVIGMGMIEMAKASLMAAHQL